MPTCTPGVRNAPACTVSAGLAIKIVHDGIGAYIEHLTLLVAVARGATIDYVPDAAFGALVGHDNVTRSSASSRLAP